MINSLNQAEFFICCTPHSGLQNAPIPIEMAQGFPFQKGFQTFAIFHDFLLNIFYYKFQ